MFLNVDIIRENRLQVLMGSKPTILVGDELPLNSASGASLIFTVLQVHFRTGKRGTKRVLEYGRLAMGFANGWASRYANRYCPGGYSSTHRPAVLQNSRPASGGLPVLKPYNPVIPTATIATSNGPSAAFSLSDFALETM